MTVEIGLDTFGDVSLDAEGKLKPMDQVIRDVVDQAVLADELGIHFIGLGEHHRPDFAISAPEMILAAAFSFTAKRSFPWCAISCKPERAAADW